MSFVFEKGKQGIHRKFVHNESSTVCATIGIVLFNKPPMAQTSRMESSESKI